MKKIILIFILILIIFMVQKSSYFTITEIEFNECKNFDNQVIKNSLKDLNYFSDSKRVIKEKVLSVPIVESVVINKKFPNGINLDILYKEPFLKVIDNDIIIITDDEGYVLTINNALDTDYSITGFEIMYYKVGKKLEIYNQTILNDVFSLIKLIKKSGVDIKEIIEYNGNDVCVYTSAGIEVEFGDCSEIEKKFNNFINVYYDLIEKDIRYGVIDVSITDLPLFRKEKK